MKIGTIVGVLAAAAAVAAIAIAAPARAEASPGRAAPNAAVDCATPCAREAAEPGMGTAAWLLMLTGFFGLGAMLRAARPAFPD